MQRLSISPRIAVLSLMLLFAPDTRIQGQQPIPSSANAPFQSPLSTATENWNRLAVNKTEFQAVAPVVGQTDTFPEFTRELVRVEWRPGDPIDLYIVRPAGVAKPPVILYLYGYPREAVRFLDPNFCTTVTRGGFAAVGFSPLLTGQRYHDLPMKVWFVSELERSLVATAHDVQQVLNYLADRNDFDLSRTGVFGEGSGATVGLLAASVDPRIKAVDMLNPWGDWKDWLAQSTVVPDRERPALTTTEFLQQVSPLDPVNVLPGMTALPIRLQQTMWTPEEVPGAARDRIRAAVPAQATVLRYRDQQEYINLAGTNGRMLDWLMQTLHADHPREP